MVEGSNPLDRYSLRQDGVVVSAPQIGNEGDLILSTPVLTGPTTFEVVVVRTDGPTTTLERVRSILVEPVEG